MNLDKSNLVFDKPFEVALDSKDSLYVADKYNHLIQKHLIQKFALSQAWKFEFKNWIN